MTALDVFLAIVGIGVTVLAVAGMVLLEPRHLISPAIQTDLSDVKPPDPGGPNINRSRATVPVTEPSRGQLAVAHASPKNGDRPAADRRTRVQPEEHS